MDRSSCLFLIAVIIIDSILIICSILLYTRRKTFPIKNRALSLLILFNVWVVIECSTQLLSSNCVTIYWARLLNIPILISAISIRFIHTWATQNIQEKMVHNENLRDSNFKERLTSFLTSNRHLLLIFLFSVIIILTILLPISHVWNFFAHQDQDHDLDSLQCDDTSDGYKRLLLASDIIVSVPIVVLIVILFRIRESLFLKIELMPLSLALLLLLLHHVSLFIFMDSISNYIFYIYYQSFIAFFILSSFIPTSPLLLLKSYQYERISRKKSIELPEILHSSSRHIKQSNSASKDSEHDLFSSITSVEMNPFDDGLMSVTTNDDANSIVSCLYNDDRRKKFRMFLSTEFCAENIKFWEAVGRYRATEDEIRLDLARSIVAQYVGTNSRTPVNISGKATEAILSQLKQDQSPRSLFDDAQDEIVTMLHCGEYQRFLMSSYSPRT